jgi:hypothetical protein
VQWQECFHEVKDGILHLTRRHENILTIALQLTVPLRFYSQVHRIPEKPLTTSLWPRVILFFLVLRAKSVMNSIPKLAMNMPGLSKNYT